MSAETLREAARKMRERAEDSICSCGGPVCSQPTHWYGVGELRASLYGADPQDSLHNPAPHIASWHPGVALAVADWLDEVAERQRPAEHWGRRSHGWTGSALANRVARAYLGDAS